MSKHYDAIVIGAGHNGLTCAAYLARSGRQVLVLEKRHLVGGAAVTEEIHPGFKFSACSYVVILLRPWIIRDLNLPAFGYEVLPLDSTFTPFPDGRYLLRDSDAAKTRHNIAQFSQRDAERYPEFGKTMGELGRLAKPLIDTPVPQPGSWNPKELFELLRMGRVITGKGTDWTVAA